MQLGVSKKTLGFSSKKIDGLLTFTRVGECDACVQHTHAPESRIGKKEALLKINNKKVCVGRSGGCMFLFLKRRRRRYMRKQKSEAAKSSYPTEPRGLRGKEKDFRIWTFFLPFVFLLFALQKSKTKPRAMLLEFSDTCGRFPQKQSNFESPSLFAAYGTL